MQVSLFILNEKSLSYSSQLWLVYANCVCICISVTIGY